MGKMQFLLGLVFLSLGAAFLPAQSASAAQILQPLLTQRPHQGLWWNPQRDGNYYLISVGPTGLAYVTTNLQIEGRSQSYVLIGQLENAPGVRALLRSKLYQRVGGGLAASASDLLRTEQLGDVELRFGSSTTATLTLPGGKVEPIEAFPLHTNARTSPAGRLPGNYHAVIRTVDVDKISEVWIGRIPIIDNPLPKCGATSALVQSLTTELQNLEIISLSQYAPRYQLLDSAQGCRVVGNAQRVDDALELQIEERGVQAVLYEVHPSMRAPTYSRIPVQAGLYWTPGVDGYFWHVVVSPEGLGYVSVNAFDAQGRQDYHVLQAYIGPGRFQTGQMSSPIIGVADGSAPGTAGSVTPSITNRGSATLYFDEGWRATYTDAARPTAKIQLEKLALATTLEERIASTFARRIWLKMSFGEARAVRFNVSTAMCGQPAGETLLQANDNTFELFGASSGSVRTVYRAACERSQAPGAQFLFGPLICTQTRDCERSGHASDTEVGVDAVSNGSLTRFYPLPQDWRE